MLNTARVATSTSEPGGQTEETIDLNSRCFNMTIDSLFGERANETIDCNESHVVIGEIVSIGEPRKIMTRGNPSGPRLTTRRSFKTRSLEVGNTTIIKDAASSQLIHEIPKLPDALPKFTVKATIEVTREGGGKRIFEKAVEIDISDERAASQDITGPSESDFAPVFVVANGLNADGSLIEN